MIGRFRMDPAYVPQVALVFSFAGLSIAWAEFITVPTSLWTGLQYALMGAALLLNYQHLRRPGAAAWTHLFWLATFPLFATLSWLATEGFVAGREEILGRTLFVVTLGVTEFLFGLVLARCVKLPALLFALFALVGHSILRQDMFTSEGIAEMIIQRNIVPNYQFAGDAIACAAVMAVAMVRGRLLCALVVGAAIWGLFIVSSRSAAFIGGGALLLSLLRFIGWRSAVVMTIAALLAGLVLQQVEFDDSIDALSSGTRFETLFSADGDSSAAARNQSLAIGLELIAQHPLTGFFAFELEHFGIGGLYVHNFLDVWVQAGVLTFALFMASMVAALVQFARLVNADPGVALRYLPLLLFVLGSWALARVPYAGSIVVAFGFLVTRMAIELQAIADRADARDAGALPVRLPAGVRLPGWHG